MDFYSIEWKALWQVECLKSHWQKTYQQDLWDKRAAIFGCEGISNRDFHNKDSYVSKMLERIEVNPEWNVLDIGCGPGALTIPLAKTVRSITALDISSRMLDQLRTNSLANDLNNILYVNASWQDAFKHNIIMQHDVTVASRSLMTIDIEEALTYIIAATRHAVYLTFPIVHLPFDYEVYNAIGSDGEKHPSYIYVYDMLYQMGIEANVEILNSKIKVQFSNIEEAEEQLKLRLAPLAFPEMERLKDYLIKTYGKDSSGFSHEGYSRFALIWWKNST
jgi:predicted TPR repeat methyltransferase